MSVVVVKEVAKFELMKFSEILDCADEFSLALFPD